MSRETIQLAEYVAALRYEDIPADVLSAAKNTIADGIGACVFGYRFPWSQAIMRYATRASGPGGKSTVLGPQAAPLHPPFAALVNGALAHSFELDAGTQRGVGAHPFGTVFTAALPVAQDRGLSGKKLLTAFVAGSEAMLRIGKATGRSNEHRGFHAPGTTGPFGAAIACALLLGLDADRLLNAIGIAGSLASGLRQFSVSETGSMVKRLHFGRAAEGGVLAAGLAEQGFDGPHDVLEGKAGFLKVFCDHYDAAELTRGLDGTTFLVREIAMKRFATHGSSQIPLQALQEIRAQHAFAADEIESIFIAASPEAVEHHDNPSPADLMQLQYSVPYCVAVACVRDARDPRSFDESALTDPAIRAIVQRVRYEAGDISDKRTYEMTVTLKSGAVYRGMFPDADVPWRPASRDEAYEKYSILMRDCPRAQTDDLFERIQTLEDQSGLGWLKI
ncbi:MAG: MmgE/PrpD family protein [Xanthobacteraceae bacterium]